MVDTPDIERPLSGSSLAVLLSVAHRAHVFFSAQLRSSFIKAALSISPHQPLPHFFSLQSKIGAEACCVARPSPGHGLWCGVDYQRQEERDTDLWNTAFFHISCSKTANRISHAREGSAVQRQSIQCSRQGGGGVRYRDIHCQCPPLM